ncbi:protein FAR1-RELATED SEQUENCE 5-like [Chenopodium quinoa]|uniref:protein FAR1-RELATED SEQUENCE 5-like n=1 Tax=Chenopodium quinoa TaxID=63459 RepID=UPI000B7909F1|nr:protein FAR1-RELATED SEQUENCE 5-like [Chenopodium quinoa]
MEEESEEGSCSNTSTTTNVAENLPSLKGPSVCYTPRGTKEFIPCCPPELKPTIGMPFDSLLKGFEFYKQYARFCGFVVRLGTEKRTQATDEVYLKYLYCNKQGFTKDGETKGRVAKKEGKPKARKRTINRVGCNAMIGIRERSDGKWMVYAFHESHSHNLASPNTMNFLANVGNLNLGQKKFIFDNSKLNIGPNKSYKLMKEHLGSYDNIGATLNDFKKFNRDLKAYIQEKDASMFINNLKEKAENSEGAFFFDHCMDEHQRLTRVFWADAISRKNYSLFCDMITFDTTFDTNKYSMVFSPFTGVDNHGKCVTFGIGLLEKEDIESFEWLFETFLKAMNNCQPACIMTYQDPTMKVAIKNVLDKAKHRFYMWHIMRKVPQKVGPKLCLETDFLHKLNFVVWNRDLEPEEFEIGWHSVISEFDLVNDDWFKNMFNIRNMWIPSYFRDLFMGEILRSTQRSGSENSFFTNFTNQHLLLVELWFFYESAIDAQRHTQDKLNATSKTTHPQLVTPLHLEKHAALVYTHNVFYIFQKEFKHALYNCGIGSATIKEEEGIEQYRIVDNTRKKSYHFTYVLCSNDASCSCRMFESVGILCRYILFVMKGKFLFEIPRQYVLHRWTKEAMKKPIFGLNNNLLDGAQKDKKQKLVGDLWYRFFSCVSLCEEKVECLESLLSKLISFENEMKDLESEGPVDKREAKNKHIELFVGSNDIVVDILPPNKSSNKGSGSGKRKKSDKEIAIEESQKKDRLCRTCGFQRRVERLQNNFIFT